MANRNNDRALDIVGWYTLAAATKGAIPVPATSLAIVANNGFMLTHICAVMGQNVGVMDVLVSVGVMQCFNSVGRTVFVEGAKLLGWGTGSWWAFFGLSALGATTAGLQTYTVGLISIEICKNGGQPIDKSLTSQLIEFAELQGVRGGHEAEKRLGIHGCVRRWRMITTQVTYCPRCYTLIWACYLTCTKCGHAFVTFKGLLKGIRHLIRHIMKV
jgi:hypothetical protein